MTRRIVFYFLIVFFTYTSCLSGMGSTPPHKYIPVRVLIVKNAENIDLRIKGEYRLVDFGTGKTLREGKDLKTMTIFAKDIDSEGIKVLAEDRSRVYIQDRQFRGGIDIIKTDDANVMVINHIDLEEYLYGVLYHEVSHRWPIEVLKAQAVVARTYALYQKLITKNKYYDLYSDIYSQVYGGRRSETWRTRKAVDLTSGMVLLYNDKVFPAYYHATCGGHTSDATTLWNIDIPVLRGKICNFCKISPHYKWSSELYIKDIELKLKQAGHGVRLTSIEILNRDEAGRIMDILLKGKDRDIKLNGNKFRLAVGPNIIRSTNFEIRTKGNVLIFEGKGWGHGIGMCQWGAYGMAREGHKAEEILEYYYPGAEIARLK